MSAMVILQFLIATLLPIAASAVLYACERRQLAITLDPRRWMLLVGCAFGLIAVIGTEVGIPQDGAIMNVRDAAPLCAGLLFGGPAGIIAGLIGGVERWFASYWGAGDFTRLACSLATILVGFGAALLRARMFEHKRPAWPFALAIGVVGEVLHLTLIFLTNLDAPEAAYHVVRVCSAPMIFCNSVSVALATLVVALMSGEPLHRSHEEREIAHAIQVEMLIAVNIAFVITMAFTIVLQQRLTSSSTTTLLELNVEDVESDIHQASDKQILSNATSLAQAIGTVEGATHEDLMHHASERDAKEISVIDRRGIIVASTNETLVGYDMGSDDDTKQFLELLPDGEKTSLVQEYRPMVLHPDQWRKYAGASLPDGCVEVGYDAEQFQDELYSAVLDSVNNRHVGKTGFLVVADVQGNIVSTVADLMETNLSEVGLNVDLSSIPEKTVFETTYRDTPCYGMYLASEGYNIIALYPCAEADFSRNVDILVGSMMEIVVFGFLFAAMYFLIKKLVVDSIRRVNVRLAQITDGDLDAVVDVRESVEFASLSDDINATVDTLKRYIAEAETRYDQDLEYGRTIQRAALPSVFPAYPNHEDFELFASMNPAKEVGGDFYDFYLLDDDHLAFLVADVSGKGIPGAMFMMRAKTVLRSLINSGLPVEEVFTQANDTLCEGNEADMFVTAWMGVIDLATGHVVFGNAGHNPPAVRHGLGHFELLDMRKNLILGCMPGVPYRSAELDLEPGDIIFLYTDGVVEAMNEEEHLYGNERMLAALDAHANNPMEALCRELRTDVDAFVGTAPQFDDITMLALKYLGRPEAGDSMRAVLTVPAEIANVDRVTAFVDERLEELDCPMRVQLQIDVAIDEILANICSYAYGEGTGMVSVSFEPLDGGRAVRMTFEDTGIEFDPLLRPAPDTTLPIEKRGIGGYGIYIVRKTMDDVSYERRGDRNILGVVKRLR